MNRTEASTSVSIPWPHLKGLGTVAKKQHNDTQHNDIQYKNILNLTLRIIALDTVMLSVENKPNKLSEIM